MSGAYIAQLGSNFQAQKERIKALFFTSGTVVSGMLASTVADMITQVFMARLGKNELTANQWIGTYRLFQNSFSAPMNTLYGLLGDQLGVIHSKNTEIEKQAARENMFRMAQQGIYYAAASSVFVAAAFWFSGFILQKLFHQKPR